MAAESYKFTRLFPLNQDDFPNTDYTKEDCPGGIPECEGMKLADAVRVKMPSSDYTPPELITLMFTDLGVLTPSAVGDELIKMYQ